MFTHENTDPLELNVHCTQLVNVPPLAYAAPGVIAVLSLTATIRALLAALHVGIGVPDAL